MEAVNFNLSFFDCLADFFLNCLSNSLNWNFSEIENFICKYYNIKKTDEQFYDRMAYLYSCFYENREEFKNEVQKIKEFATWITF